MVLRYLDRGNLASFTLACHKSRDIVEPLLYSKVFTKINTHNDTPALVDFLLRRPHVVGFIRSLVLDEFHPVAYRQLMAIEFPNLESITVEQDIELRRWIGDEKRRSLNQLIREQPKLTNLTFWIEVEDEPLFKLEEDDAILFRHRKLQFMRMSHIDFSAFEQLEVDYLWHSKLKLLFVEQCYYTYEAFDRLLSPTAKLQNILISHNNALPFSEKLYPALLSPVRESLRILDLTWRWNIPFEAQGMDFTGFLNLHFLRVPPIYLLGDAYMEVSELPNLIPAKFPPNLKMLLLENIVPRSVRLMNERGVVFPGYPPPGYTLALTLMPRDCQLIKYLITEKANVLPRLKYILMYYMELMEDPSHLYPLAKEYGVTLGPLLSTDYLNPLVEWLDGL